MMCAAGDLPPEEAFAGREQAEPEEPEELCVVCGRETGFLGAPQNLRATVEGDAITLEWDEVDAADKYAVHGLRAGRNAAFVEQSYVWFTEETRLTIALEAGHAYTFYVVAWDEDGKTRSRASRPVRADL